MGSGIESRRAVPEKGHGRRFALQRDSACNEWAQRPAYVYAANAPDGVGVWLAVLAYVYGLMANGPALDWDEMSKRENS